MLGVVFDQIQKGPLASALRGEDFHFVAGSFGQRLFQQFAIFEIDGHVNRFRQIFRFQIKLLQQRRNEFVGIEILQVFPVKFTAIDHAATTQVKQICGNQRRLRIVSQNIGVIALRGGDALPLLDILQRAQQIAIGGGLLEKFLLGRGGHAFFQALDQIVAAAFKKQPRIARPLPRSAHRWSSPATQGPWQRLM